MTKLDDLVTRAADPNKQYVRVASAGLNVDLSASGKAVQFSLPKHDGLFWAPVSLLRKRATHQFGMCDDIVLPVWFMINNRIPF